MTEALATIQPAVEVWLEAAKKAATPIPVPTMLGGASSKFLMRLPRQLRADLARTAKREDVSSGCSRYATPSPTGRTAETFTAWGGTFLKSVLLKGCEMVDKNWTLKDAIAANDKALADNPSLSIGGPSLPLYQWFALHHLDVCQRYYDDGDSYWLMTAIRICANHDLALPEWAAMAYIKAYDKVNKARAKSWNTVFGDPYPKGSNLNAIRKRITLKFAVLNKIHAILAMSPDTPIDVGLFECVGKELNIGKTLASEYYYLAKKEAESIGK